VRRLKTYQFTISRTAVHKLLLAAIANNYDYVPTVEGMGGCGCKNSVGQNQWYGQRSEPGVAFVYLLGRATQ